MDSAVIGSNTRNIRDLLLSRFPDIAFALSLEEVQPLSIWQDSRGWWHGIGKRGALYEEDIEKEVLEWKSSLHLEGIDVLYIYGIGLGAYYLSIKEWLTQGSDKMIVFFEDDLCVLQTLFSLPIGLEILQDPKVEIRFLSSPIDWTSVFEIAVREWISDQVDFTALASYRKGKEKKIKKNRYELLRISALMHVALTESLHYDKLIQNIHANFCELPNASHVNRWKDICEGIPAIICGAGVSLAKVACALKEAENKAIIIAGGSAITALHHFGIRPHIALATDPNEEEYLRIKAAGCFEIPFVYSSRLHKEVLSCTNVKPGYLCADTGGAFETWMHEKLNISYEPLGPELGVEALSVTTLAVPLARYLGCKHILFCGVDLSYKNLQRYPPGVLPSARIFLEELQKERRSLEKLVRKKNGEGRFVYSLVKWVMEANCLEEYMQKDGEGHFFNASLEGLPIPCARHLSLEKFFDTCCLEEYDIRGRLHAAMERTKLQDVTKENVSQAFEELNLSLQECERLVKELLLEIKRKKEMLFSIDLPWESGKMQVLEMDLKEEEAYKVCLSSVLSVYRKVVERKYPTHTWLDPEERYYGQLSKERRIWEECIVVIESCKEVLKRNFCEDFESKTVF